jgi:hypothetical protein
LKKCSISILGVVLKLTEYISIIGFAPWPVDIVIDVGRLSMFFTLANNSYATRRASGKSPGGSASRREFRWTSGEIDGHSKIEEIAMRTVANSGDSGPN